MLSKKLVFKILFFLKSKSFLILAIPLADKKLEHQNFILNKVFDGFLD